MSGWTFFSSTFFGFQLGRFNIELTLFICSSFFGFQLLCFIILISHYIYKMKTDTLFLLIALLFILLTITACGFGDDSWTAEHGYGPITEPLELGEISEAKALEGRKIFATYCEACHTMNASISGPALGRTASRRTPEFIVNYTLNPRENSQNHPIGQELSDQYPGIMADTGISAEQALAVLEYMRFYSEYREEPDGA